MTKQADNQDRKRLLQQAISGSFIKRYHTHFCAR